MFYDAITYGRQEKAWLSSVGRPGEQGGNMTTIEEYHEMSIQDKLTWIYEQLVCTIEPLCDQILDHIQGEEDAD